MLTVDDQRSMLEQALVFYQAHLESLREQQENNFPRNGKARANSEDLSNDHVLEEQLEVIASILTGSEESPEQIVQMIKRPPRHPYQQIQTLEPQILDVFDSQPYVNPFTGQMITPGTPFTAGTSNSHINASVLRTETAELQIINRNPEAAPKPGEPPTRNAPAGPATSRYYPEPDIGRSRLPLSRSMEDSMSFNSRRVIPAARSHAAEPTLSEDVPFSKSHSSTISCLKHITDKASSLRIRGKTRGKTLREHDRGNASHKGDNTALNGLPSWGSSPTTAGKAGPEARQSLHQLSHGKGPHPTPNLRQSGLVENVNDVRRHPTLLRNQIGTSGSAAAPPTVRRQSRSTASDTSNVNQLEAHARPFAEEVPLKTFWEPEASAPDPKQPPPPMRHTSMSAIQPPSAASLHQKPNQLLSLDHMSPENLADVDIEPTHLLSPRPAYSEQLERRAGGSSEFSNSVAQAIQDDDSLNLALELSGWCPQDFASLKLIQREQEISARLIDSWRLAKQLAGDSPQDYGNDRKLHAKVENPVNDSTPAGLERQEAFEADRKLAESLAAADTPQQMHKFHQLDGQRQLELQEDARVAQEVCEREDQAEREAQLAVARHLQAEWDASEARQMAELQRLAQEVADTDDRLELERLQAQWSDYESSPRTSLSTSGADSSSNTDVGSSSQALSCLSEANLGPVSTGRPSIRASPRPQHGSTNSSSNHDAEDLLSLVAERPARQRESHAEVQRQQQQQQQQWLAERAQRKEDTRRAAIEAQQGASQAGCTVCAAVADKSDMAVLSCKHVYCGDCIARKSRIPFRHIFHANRDNRGIPTGFEG